MTLNNSDKNQFCPLPTTATSPNKQHTKPNTITAEHISMQPGSHPGWLSSDCQIVSLLLLCKIFLETAHVDVAFSNPQWCCSSYGQKYCISEEKEKLHWPLPEAAPLTAIWEVRRSTQCWTGFLKELYTTGTKNNNTQPIGPQNCNASTRWQYTRT